MNGNSGGFTTAVARLAAVAAALALSGAASAADDPIVNCHDAKRDVVTAVVAGQCAGEVVSDERAAEIKARRAAAIRRAMKGPPPALYPGKRRAGHGSGFFFSRAGHVMTNNHVIEKCAAVSVHTTTGKQARAKVVATDPRHDLAVLKAAIRAPAAAAFRPDDGDAAGRDLYIVGYPTRTLPPIKPQLTLGTTLGAGDTTLRGLELPPWFVKMDAFVYPGNSGGPALDAGGRVYGVVVAQINTVKVFERTGDLKRGIGFAIANRYVFRFLDRHEIPYDTRAEAPEHDAEAVFGDARPFIARISCWK